MTTNSPWLVRRPIDEPRLRLFCFPYAGGSAADFLPWHAALAPQIEVCAMQLPGRGARMWETPATSMAEVVESLAEAIASVDDGLPFAFLGHSLGALLAFEVCHYRQRLGRPAPVHLFASACDAPPRRALAQPLHLLDDDALIDVLRRFEGTPPQLLENRDLMRLVLPSLRADFSLAGNYAYRPSPPLSMPITVLAGTRDDHVNIEHVGEWAAQTEAHCVVHHFDGGHFFIKEHASAMQACVEAALAPCLLDAAGLGQAVPSPSSPRPCL